MSTLKEISGKRLVREGEENALFCVLYVAQSLVAHVLYSYPLRTFNEQLWTLRVQRIARKSRGANKSDGLAREQACSAPNALGDWSDVRGPFSSMLACVEQGRRIWSGAPAREGYHCSEQRV